MTVVLLLVCWIPAPVGARGASFVAPFSMSVIAIGDYSHLAGCHASVRNPINATANTTLGTFNGTSRAVASACAGAGSNASTQPLVEFDGFGFTPHSSRVNVTVTWTISWTARATVLGPSNATGYGLDSSYALVTVGSVLLNTATGGYDSTYRGTANLAIFSQGSITPGTVSGHARGGVYVTSAIFAVTPGILYLVQLQVDASSSAASSVVGITASAEADVFATLSGVTIT